MPLPPDLIRESTALPAVSSQTSFHIGLKTVKLIDERLLVICEGVLGRQSGSSASAERDGILVPPPSQLTLSLAYSDESCDFRCMTLELHIFGEDLLIHPLR